jgi:hypothetical protein
MALEYVLGNFKTGEIIARDITVTRGTDKVNNNINGGTLEIEVSRNSLTTEQRNNWKTYFKPFAKFLALIDTEKAWNDPGAVRFAGFINKRSAPVGKGFIRLQTVGMNDYLASRLVINAWDGVITDPTAKITVTGASWGGVMAELVKKAFSPLGIPEGAPKPPAVLGAVMEDAGTAFTKEITFTDALTYRDALGQIRDSDSPNGVEWRWYTRFTNSSANFIAWDFVTGTSTAPHINGDITKTIELSPAAAEKMSAFSESIDSRDIFNAVYIQSKEGEETSGADLQVAFSNADPELPLIETFFNPGVQLTQEQIDAQKAARLSSGTIGSIDVSFTIEEAWDSSEWDENIGKKIVFTGVPDSISSDHSVAVRCVGIEYSAQKATVEVSLMQLQNSYPVLPKDKKPFGNNNNYKPTPFGASSLGSGGGLTPLPLPAPSLPSPGGFGIDGILSPADLWGSEGRAPWDENKDKKVIQNVTFSDFLEKEYIYTNFGGVYPIDPITCFLDSGNRVYGLDHLNQAVATKFENDGVHVHYLGGLNKSTGVPLDGWKPFYIKKTYVANGELGPIEELDVVTPEMIKGMLAEYEDQTYSNGGYYRTNVMASNWTSAGRYYFCLMHHYDHSEKAVFERGGDYDDTRYIANSRVSIISKAINESSGKLEGDWKTEAKDILPEWFFPVNKAISRYGKAVIFTTFLPINPRKVKNENTVALEKAADEFKAKYIYEYNSAITSPVVHPTINVRTAKNQSAYLWPAYPYPQLRTGNMRKNFGDVNSGWGLLLEGSGFHGNSASSEGYLALQSGYYVRLQSDAMIIGASENYPTGSAYHQDITVSGGNFILFGSKRNESSNELTAAAWAVSAQNPQGDYKIIDNDILPKFEFWAGQFDLFSDGSSTYGEAGIRDFWVPGFASSYSGGFTSPSDIMSYSGGLYKFILSGQDRIILHSLKVIEDPNPPAPPVSP